MSGRPDSRTRISFRTQMRDDDDDDDEDEYIPCKIVLLGEAGVGKTSIITRYISGSFSKIVMTSTGSSYVAKKI